MNIVIDERYLDDKFTKMNLSIVNSKIQMDTWKRMSFKVYTIVRLQIFSQLITRGGHFLAS